MMEGLAFGNAADASMPHRYDAPALDPCAVPPGLAATCSAHGDDARDHHRISRGFRYISVSDGNYDDSVVKSAHRVLLIFEFFAEYGRPASAIEIAVTLDFPQSSTSMLLRSLVSTGYLDFDPATRLYAPTIRVSLLGLWQRGQADLTSDILCLVDRLHAETGECVLLAEQYRAFMRCIYVRQSEDPDKVLYMPLGTLRPICSTALGQMLLAQMPESDAALLIRAALADRGSADYGLEYRGVTNAVASARERGFACTSRLVNDLQTFQIATILPGRAGRAPFAIGIISYEDRFLGREQQLLDRLRALA
jgi:DNA-binding IclR family transcriptional regulator